MRFFKRSRFSASEEGSTLVEIAIVMPVIVLLTIGSVDIGLAYKAGMAVTSGAQAGALYGIAYPGDTAGMISAAKLDASTLSAMTATATYACECFDGSGSVGSCTALPTCSQNAVDVVQVNTQTIYTPMFSYPGIPSTITLTGKATMRAAH